MMDQALTWGALIMSMTSILAMIKFWIWIGTKMEKVAVAERTANAAVVRAELNAAQLADHKLEVSKQFVTISTLADTEMRFTRAVAELNGSVKHMTERLDRAIELLLQNKRG